MPEPEEALVGIPLADSAKHGRMYEQRLRVNIGCPLVSSKTRWIASGEKESCAAEPRVSINIDVSWKESGSTNRGRIMPMKGFSFSFHLAVVAIAVLRPQNTTEKLSSESVQRRFRMLRTSTKSGMRTTL